MFFESRYGSKGGFFLAVESDFFSNVRSESWSGFFSKVRSGSGSGINPSRPATLMHTKIRPLDPGVYIHYTGGEKRPTLEILGGGGDILSPFRIFFRIYIVFKSAIIIKPRKQSHMTTHNSRSLRRKSLIRL